MTTTQGAFGTGGHSSNTLQIGNNNVTNVTQ